MFAASSHRTSKGLEDWKTCDHLKALDGKRDEFRLLTILPLSPDEPESSQVECRLNTFCLNEEHFTSRYKQYLNNKSATGAWVDPQSLSERLSPGQDLGAWIEVIPVVDDATTHLPEFRYEWGDYLALSYTWNGPDNLREIIVNGQPVTVTQNAEACLKVLRKKKYIQDGWMIWIDAICIDQSDIIERASQVKRMREIYSKAWTPLIWLGEKRENSDCALDLITTLASEFSQADGVHRLTSTLRRNPEHFGRGVWRALYEIAVRRYWRRLWIFQEVSLGRSNTPVLCGNRTIAWNDFALAFSLLVRTDEIINEYITNDLKEAGLPFDIALWPNLYATTEIQELQDLQLEGKRPPIFSLLNLSRQVFCTDPRDKVYGLLGIMDPSLASLTEPDYTDSTLNVYRSFTLAIIESTRSLDVLRYSTPDAASGPPSWVTDWTVTPTTTALTLDETSFSSSGSSRASIQALENPHLLSCKGFIIDHFDGMSALWSQRWDPDTIIPSKGRSNPYGSFGRAREAIWKSLVACRRLPNEPLISDYGSLLATPILSGMDFPDSSPLKDLVSSNIFEWCARSLRNNASFQIAGSPLENYFWTPTEVNEYGIHAADLRDALMQKDRVGLSRKLVTTKRGYVGLALETVEQDDIVAVLLGCSMPIVLRKVDLGEGGDRWKVVGECYLHGIMDGEAMEWDLDLQDFVLC